MPAQPSSSLLRSYQTHYHDLIKFLTLRLRDHHRAADVAQETWLRLHRIDTQTVAVDNERHFIFRVASNLAIDAQRNEQRQRRHFVSDNEGAEIECPAPQPERILLARERLNLLGSVLQELPTKPRRALWLNRVEGLTHSQIANELGVSVSMVAKYIGQATRHLGAALALVVLSVLGGNLFSGSQQALHTSVGQRHTALLQDGTHVTLNSDSKLSLGQGSLNQQPVSLAQGEALFRVNPQHGAAFVVMAGSDQVSSHHATFSLRRKGDELIIVVAEGVVHVQHQGQQLALTANQMATLRPSAKLAHQQEVDASAATAWQRGKLIFNRQPLGEVLAELERYQHGRILLPDSNLAALQVSGVFDLDDPGSLLASLESRYGLQVTYLPFVAWVH